MKSRMMLFTFVALIVANLAFAGTPHTVSLNTGEWALGQGSMIGYTYDDGRLMLNPTSMMNGSCLDLFTRYDLLPNPNWTLGVGGSVGVLEHTMKTEAYVGPTMKFGWSGRSLATSVAGFTYRSRTRTILDAFNVDASYTHKALTIGTGYEPIRYGTSYWINRYDAHVAWTFPSATVTLEGRIEPNNDNRSSASVVVDVPMVFSK